MQKWIARPTMNLPWDDVQLFLAVAESKSLSQAARSLRVGQPTVSRRLAQLEEKLGCVLFQRGTQGATLTSAAERLLEPARKMAEWAAELARAVQREDSAPQGVVRITASPGMAYQLLVPFAARLRKSQPGLRLEIRSTIQYLDLARGEADLALRFRPPAQGDLVSLCVIKTIGVPYVSPAYKKRMKRNATLADLDWIVWAPPFERLSPNPELEAAIPNYRVAFASDDFLVQCRAARAGLGAVILGKVRGPGWVPEGLVPLEFDLGPAACAELHLVCTKRAKDIPRVRAVAELLTQELLLTQGTP
jgi:DNA-binding transcriptional LysR family regulator